jgi:hypothetical protein
VQLRDPIAVQFEATITIGKGGRIITTFAQVPDLPVTKFTLSFHGGRYGALALNRNLCKKGLRLPATFRGHNGKKVSQRPLMTRRGCPKRHR